MRMFLFVRLTGPFLGESVVDQAKGRAHELSYGTRRGTAFIFLFPESLVQGMKSIWYTYTWK